MDDSGQLKDLMRLLKRIHQILEKKPSLYGLGSHKYLNTREILKRLKREDLENCLDLSGGQLVIKVE